MNMTTICKRLFATVATALTLAAGVVLAALSA